MVAMQGIRKYYRGQPVKAGIDLPDEQLRDEALASFAEKARAKFDAGIAEHNPDGDKGMCKMTIAQKMEACRDEVMDLWFYLHALEKKLDL